jgi:hypothetical protein
VKKEVEEKKRSRRMSGTEKKHAMRFNVEYYSRAIM